MDYQELINIAVIAVFGGTAGVAVKKLWFFIKVALQAVALLNEMKEPNSVIYQTVKNDPNKQELARVLEGAVFKIKGLSGVNHEV